MIYIFFICQNIENDWLDTDGNFILHSVLERDKGWVSQLSFFTTCCLSTFISVCSLLNVFWYEFFNYALTVYIWKTCKPIVFIISPLAGIFA